MKRLILSIAAVALCFGAYAQAIGPEELKEIQDSYVLDASTKAIRNVLVNDKNIKSHVLDNDVASAIDHEFKYKVNVSGITDQLSSGRCWMFTSMNVLRPSVMKQFYLKEFDFSHSYCFFWDLFEKANLFLENVIATAGKDITDRDVWTYFKSPISDGGVWNLFWDIAEKYGVVPASVMPETQHSNNTSQMDAVLNEYLRSAGWNLRQAIDSGTRKKVVREMKISALKDVYRILALCMGVPPTEFTWKYKDKEGNVKTLTSTPKEFYKSIVPADYHPDTYIMIMNDPTREYYKTYEIASYRNTYEGINWVYLNLPNEEIKPAALASIKAGTPMYVSCDVGKQSLTASGKGVMDPGLFDYESLFGVSMKMDKKARILTHQSGSSHAMTLIACDTDENDVPVKWEFENSWGASAGNRGYLTFTDKWFDEYLFRIVIEKKYLSKKAADAVGTKPIVVPVWDYMF